MLDVVLFVDFLVDVSSEPRKNDFLEDCPIKKPNNYNVLDDRPAQFGDDVARVREDSPCLFPKS